MTRSTARVSLALLRGLMPVCALRHRRSFRSVGIPVSPRGSAQRSPDARALRRAQVRRRRLAAVGLVVSLVVVGVAAAWLVGGISPRTPRSASSSVRALTVPSKAAVMHRGASTAANPSTPPSIEAGVEPWQLDAPLSRESLVTAGSGLTVLGGINPAGTSLARVSTLVPTTGTASAGTPLATGVHDAAAWYRSALAYMYWAAVPQTQWRPCNPLPHRGHRRGTPSRRQSRASCLNRVPI